MDHRVKPGGDEEGDGFRPNLYNAATAATPTSRSSRTRRSMTGSSLAVGPRPSLPLILGWARRIVWVAVRQNGLAGKAGCPHAKPPDIAYV